MLDRLQQHRRRDLPRDAPFVFAPTAGDCLPAVVHNGVPVAIGFLLVRGGNLEGKRICVRMACSAIEPHARDAEHGELHREHITLFASGVVSGRAINLSNAGIRKNRRVKPRSFFCIAIKPEANGVFGRSAHVISPR